MIEALDKLFLAGCVALALGSLFGAGCGGASAEVRTAYAAEQATCLANERAIIAREGTTREQDEADYAAEQARCDAALDVIEHGGTP